MRLRLPDRDTLIDSARLALQSAVAAAAVWLVMQAFDLPHESWAVISALYVSQHSLDGTLGAVRGRMLGTLLGAAVGLASVYLFDGEQMTVLRLALSALLINAIASAAPRLRYGVVAAAIIVLEPGQDAFAGALDRVVAIGIGSLAGAFCALLVWPQSACARALRSTRQALGDCAELVEASIARLAEGDADVQPLHDRFLGHIQRARAQLAEARTRKRAVGSLRRAIHSIERLWHTLIVLDRLTGEDIERGEGTGGRSGGAIDPGLRDCLQAVRRQVRDWLREAKPAWGERALPSPSGELRSALAAARDQAEACGFRAGGVDTGGLAFALRELDKHLDEIAEAGAGLR